MRRTAVLVAGWAGCVAIATAALQTPPQAPPQTPSQKPPVFTSRVDLVQLDVEVLGKDHVPVRGLTLDDFIVKENGTPQKVVALNEVDMDDPPPPPVAWMRDVTPDVTTNAQEDSRLVVIVIDDALIPMDPFIIKNAKAAITKVIDKLGPRDLTSVVFSADNRNAQEFTHDRTALLATLDKFSPGMATWRFNAGGAGTNSDVHFYWSSVKTLHQVATYLMQVPNRRKALIWISPGIPVDIEMVAPLRKPQVGDDATGQRAVDRTEVDAMISAFQDMAEMFRQAQRANVAIYPIDPTGLGGLETYIAREVGEAPFSGPIGSPLSHRESRLSFDFLEEAAANTGGHAIVKTNDPGPGIDQIFRENGSYYLLGFQPANTKEDGTLRRIEVKVNRPGVEVRTRSQYYAPKPEDPPGTGKNAKLTPENAALAKAIGGVLIAPDLPLGVTMAPFAIPGQHAAAVAIALGVRQPIPDEAARAKITETTELQISAFTPEGDPRGTQRSTAHVKLVEGATGEAAYEVLGRIDLAPGRYSLRLAATNPSSKKTGSVAANVIVPDFTNDAFSISGVVVSRAPGKASAPRELLSSIVPIVPTADREFAPADRATTFLRLYQSGMKAIGAVSLAVRIENDRGGTDVKETQMVGTDRFVAAEPPPQTGPAPPPAVGPGFSTALKQDPVHPLLRVADVSYAIPLDKLARGQYLLTFEATLGTTTLKRNVRFSVK